MPIALTSSSRACLLAFNKFGREPSVVALCTVISQSPRPIIMTNQPKASPGFWKELYHYHYHATLFARLASPSRHPWIAASRPTHSAKDDVLVDLLWAPILR